MKFGRDYLLTVQVGPYGPPTDFGGATPIAKATREIQIKPPFTIEFDVRREFLAAAQTASIKIENLSRQTRDMIYKDHYAAAYYATVKLQAGYQGSFLSTIFHGTILEAQSHRESRTTMVTQIEAFDGGFAMGNSYSSRVLPPGYSFSGALRQLNGDLCGVSGTPIIGSVPASLGPRSTILVGPTFSLIQKLLPPNVSATIDNNQLKVMADTDVLQFGETIFVISSATGLLNPPCRQGQGVEVQMLFEPRLTVGQKVRLISEDNSKFNTDYQVKGVSHQAIISPAKGGEAVTTLQLYNFGKLNELTGAIAN